jgi:phospholipid/cholesterol/gamma-HCH transport system substrate-binding protein
VSLADASGLTAGSEVRLAGAKIGSITGVTLEQPSYRALVEVQIRDDLLLPADSRASVSSSPISGVYLALVPGHSMKTIPAGGIIGGPPPPAPPKDDQANLSGHKPG